MCADAVLFSDDDLDQLFSQSEPGEPDVHTYTNTEISPRASVSLYPAVRSLTDEPETGVRLPLTERATGQCVQREVRDRDCL